MTNRKQRGPLRRVDSAVSRGRRADGGSKLSVDKNRLRHQLFTARPHAHATSERAEGGGARARDKIF